MDRRRFLAGASRYAVFGAYLGQSFVTTPTLAARPKTKKLPADEAEIITAYFVESHRNVCRFYQPSQFGPQVFPPQYSEEEPGVFINQSVDWKERYALYNRPNYPVEEKVTSTLLGGDSSALDDLNRKNTEIRDFPFKQGDYPCYKLAPLAQLAELDEAQLASRVGFSANGESALLYTEWKCLGLCGGAGFLLYKRSADGWAVAENMQLWVS